MQLMEPPVTHSLPYQRGTEARADYETEVAAWFAKGTARELVEKPYPPPNPLVGRSGLRWAEGFTHSTEGSFSDEKDAADRIALVRNDSRNVNAIASTSIRSPEPLAPPKQNGSTIGTVPPNVCSSVPDSCKPNHSGSTPGATTISARTILIVDYSSLLHRAFHAGEPSKIHGVRSMFETIANAIERTFPDFIVFALDGGHVERSQLCPSYKAHRPPRSPLLNDQLKLGEQAIRAIGWPLVRVIGWEADDVAASLVKQIGTNAEQILLATSDKDALQTIPWGASVYKPWDKGQIISARHVRETYGVEPAQMGDYLALVGDNSDGVSGVEGIGEKTAAALLQEHKSLEAILAAAEAGTLTGKGSKQLATPEQRATARTSRQLVELCSELPVGTHWTEFPATEPTAGWKQRLIDLKLGMIAQRLADLLPNQVERERDSYFETTWSRPAPQPTPSQPTMPADIVIADDAADGTKNYVFRRVSKSPIDRTPPEPPITAATVATVPGLFGPTTLLPNEPPAPIGLPTIEPPSPLAPLPNARPLPFDEPAASPLLQVGSNIVSPNGEDLQLKAGSHVEEINDLEHAAIEADFTTLQTTNEELDSMATTATHKKPAKKSAKPEKSKKVVSPVEAVFTLLTQSPDLTDRWSKLIASNPTSEQITDQLKADWILGARAPSVPCAASTLGTIGVWIGSLTTAGQPTLQGHALIAAIREAFGKPYDYKAELQELLGTKFPTKPASDDELTVSINETLRKKTGKQKHATTVNHKTHGTAVWIDQQSTEGEPTFSTTGAGRSLLVAVRQAYEIPLVETPIEISRQIIRKPLDWFTKSPYDRREKRPQQWVVELALSMTGNEGQLQPCLAREDGQHIAGWTRVEAARYAIECKLTGWEKLTELDVRIVKCTDTQARRLVLVENAKRKDLTEREKTEAYSDLAAEYRSQGRPQRQLAEDLGISEVTLSNNLRMKAIPTSVWERHEAGGFSTDQLRRIATYADRPAFVQRLMKYVSQIEGQPEPHHFEAAFRTGINAAFRPMEQDPFGRGRVFDRKAATREALQVVEVEINGRKVEMAGNVELWNKLNKEAKLKAEKKEAESTESLTEAQKRKKEINDGIRENAIHVTWNAARMDAIVAALSGKLSKATRETLIRVVHFLGESYVPFDERLSLKDISGDDETYTAACLRVLKRALNPESAHVKPEELASLAKLTGANPVDHWKPTLHLLSTSSPEELQKFAAELNLTEEGDKLIPALLENWTVGWVPAAFKLKKAAK
ncbi:MAG: 5'-3' exonuclease H3TH domain-containing protein [Planctomycetaceae bacterium]